MMISSRISLNIWRQFAWVLYVITIIFLCIPLIFGIVTRGARGWIPIGPFNLQPSQFAQPICLLLASFFISTRNLKTWRNFVILLGIIALPLALIFIEPDFGTFVVLAGALGALIFFSDIPLPRLGLLGIAMSVLLILTWQFLLQPYQKQRITGFFSTSGEQSYNAEQSLIAVGSGQLLGRGLGHGVQSQLRFLPERQTDFIFASLAEETGFIGSSLVLGLYFFLLSYLTFTALKFTPRSPQQLLFLGAVTLLFIQIFINVGMNSSIMPITGITLPFISYGGSSLLSFAFLLGLLQHCIVKYSQSPLRSIR